MGLFHTTCAACRIPLSTCHSQIAKWCGNKPRVLVLNRLDMISERDKVAWTRHFNAAGTHVCWTNGVSGLGTGQVGDVYCSLCLRHV